MPPEGQVGGVFTPTVPPYTVETSAEVGGAAARGARGAAAARVAGARGAIAREQEEEVVNVGRAVAVDIARGVLTVGR